MRLDGLDRSPQPHKKSKVWRFCLFAYAEWGLPSISNLFSQEKLKLLEKVIIALGQAEFKMDIVSHLSMKADVDEGMADAH